jgi:hypothetical protein
MRAGVDYALGVAAHSATGSSSLELRAHQRSPKRFFCARVFYGGCHGGAYERAVSLSRPASPVASATISRLAAVGGGSQYQRITP